MNYTERLEYAKEKFKTELLFSIENSKGILFAFTEGQELKTHTTPADAWLIMLEGECRFTMEGNDSVLKTGSITRIPKDVPHSIYATTNFKMLLIR